MFLPEGDEDADISACLGLIQEMSFAGLPHLPAAVAHTSAAGTSAVCGGGRWSASVHPY